MQFVSLNLAIQFLANMNHVFSLKGIHKYFTYSVTENSEPICLSLKHKKLSNELVVLEYSCTKKVDFFVMGLERLRQCTARETEQTENTVIGGSKENDQAGNASDPSGNWSDSTS